MGLALVLTACANTAVNTVTDDEVTSEVAEAAKGDTIEDISSTTASTEEVTEASTEASSEEVVEAVIETSTENTDTTVVEATVTEADVTESVQVSTSASSTLTGKTGANGWPVISGYKGDGNGPGLAWRSDINYLEKFPDMMGSYDDIEAYTASNGVTIKVIVAYNGNNKVFSPIIDGEGKDLESSSPFMTAVNEAFYGANGLYTDTDLSANVNATLPNTSYKRTSIDPNDASVVAYKQAYDYKRSTADGGTYYSRPAGTINDSIFFFTDGVGEYDKKGVALWEFRNTGSYWSLTIYQNPAEYQWSGIKEVLEYLSPDGAALYNVIYTDCYTGSEVIQEWDTWWPVGGSQIYQPNPDAANRILTYYFN
jgi:hypothetical protein